MQLFCNKQKTAGNKLFNFVKSLKKNETEGVKMNNLILNKPNEKQGNYSLHSENFLDCPENNENIIIGTGNKLEKIVNLKKIESVINVLGVKIQNVKEKLGLKFARKNSGKIKEIENQEKNDKKQENTEDLYEFIENPGGELFSRRETILASTSRSEKKESNFIRKNVVFKSIKVDHDDDENQTKDAEKEGGNNI